MTRTERLKTDKNWYYVPPYKSNEDDIVVDAAGQRVAVFERKEDALKCVESHNKHLERTEIQSNINIGKGIIPS